MVKGVVTAFEPAHVRALEEIDAEKMRQLYVALTRAKERLYVPVVTDKELKPVAQGTASPVELFLTKCLCEQPVSAKSVRDLLAPLHPDVTCVSVEPVPIQRQPDVLVSVVSKKQSILPQTPHYIYSFSSLQRTHTPEPLPLLPTDLIPTGADTGILLHAILEQIFKFQLHAPLQETQVARLIEKTVRGTPLQPFQPLLLPWIVEILSTDIAGFTLRDLSSFYFQEMEFYFSMGPHGTMKGFCDLLFAHGGKYYILDWKSNQLAEYTEAGIEQAMHAHDYFLQAAIYKEALRRYVKLFDTRPFEELFGGAIYFFLRGCKPYIFQPREDVLERMAHS
jgi:exodeoxyribonuclease V beta subunit